MAKDKPNSKAFTQQKRRRRQWLTFMRMCRYGINNLSRNAWLTIAATAMMSITLLTILLSYASRNVLLDTVAEVRDKVDVSIYVKNTASEADVAKIKIGLKRLPSIRSVSYTSPQEARERFAEQNKKNPAILATLNEATNLFPGTFSVKPADINNLDELKAYVTKDPVVKANVDPQRQPSYAGARRSALSNIGKWVGFAERSGLILSVVFIAISSLIVFNTIRMAIFSRKDEIQMMKLIGADSRFIRGPFIVEAIFYGLFAALIASGLGLLLFYGMDDVLQSYGIAVSPTMNFFTNNLWMILLAMIGIGALIGVMSSLLATRKYLKI